MNRFERLIYNLVRSNPRLKNTIRNAYQAAWDLLPSKKVETRYEIVAREGFFFGFHDHTPFSHDDSKLLANRFTIPLRMPELGETLEVGYFDGPNHNEYHAVAETCAWLWHMGCKLQWRGKRDQIVFNDHKDGRNIARVVDVHTGTDHVLPDSIGSVSPDGEWAVGYSFARVARCMPGYGYHYDIGDPELNVTAPQRNGLHSIHLDSGEQRLLFSLQDLAGMNPEKSMQDALHFVSHTVFSPDSQRFIFLHRWIDPNGDINKRWSRLISSDLEGNRVNIFPTVEMVSHIGWRGPGHVIAYCRVPEHDDQYVLFDDAEPERYEIVGLGQFSSDGHPSFDPTGRWMVTDTYPDRRRVQTLVLYDILEMKRYDIARLPMPKRFQSPSAYKHWSCDLHPRWDGSGTRLCFDATHTGERSLCTLDLGRDFGAELTRSLPNTHY